MIIYTIEFSLSFTHLFIAPTLCIFAHSLSFFAHLINTDLKDEEKIILPKKEKKLKLNIQREKKI